MLLEAFIVQTRQYMSFEGSRSLTEFASRASRKKLPGKGTILPSG